MGRVSGSLLHEFKPAKVRGHEVPVRVTLMSDISCDIEASSSKEQQNGDGHALCSRVPTAQAKCGGPQPRVADVLDHLSYCKNSYQPDSLVSAIRVQRGHSE